MTRPHRKTEALDLKAMLPYIAGFGLSVVLTLIAYVLVANHIMSDWVAVYTVVGLAIVQLVVQLMFFMHMGRESEPRWNLLVFDFTLIVVIILVVGSLWIMNNLHYNMTPPADADQQVIRDEGIHR
jgi:cytochrome o ubiquinol oxidase operon protein cyoD